MARRKGAKFMKIAILRERSAGETRVAATPESIVKLAGLGADVMVETGAGEGSRISDRQFEEAGAKIGASAAATVTGADLVGGYSGVPRVCDVRLLVPERYRDGALEVLSAYERRRPAGAEWRCAGCGEPNAASFETCWSCGAAA